MKINKERKTFTAIFQKHGKKSGYHGYLNMTILLSDLKSTDGEILTDHLWMNVGKRIEELKLTPGNIIQFDARVKPYVKGYSKDDDENPKRIDYGLEYPSKLSIIGNSEKDFSHLIFESEKILDFIKEHNQNLKDNRMKYHEQKENDEIPKKMTITKTKNKELIQKTLF